MRKILLVTNRRYSVYHSGPPFLGFNAYVSERIRNSLLQSLKREFQWDAPFIPWEQLTYRDFNAWPSDVKPKDLYLLSSDELSKLLASINSLPVANELKFSAHFANRYARDFKSQRLN